MWSNGIQFATWLGRAALVSFLFGFFASAGWWIWSKYAKYAIFGGHAHDDQESAWRFQGIRKEYRQTTEQQTLDRIQSEKAARSSGDQQGKTEG